MRESAAPTERTRLGRLPERGRHDAETIAAILDEGLVAALGVVVDGAPRVLPVAYARDGERVLFHGSSGSALFRGLRDGREVCLTVTLLDGLVLARSGFHHSMNYRSVVVYGQPRELTGADARQALDVIVDAVVPGRAATLRPPTTRELAATVVYALPLDEASAKLRTGGVHDEPEDLGAPVWAGVVPVRQVLGAPEPDTGLPAGLPAPALAR